MEHTRLTQIKTGVDRGLRQRCGEVKTADTRMVL